MSLDYRWIVPGALAAGAHPARDLPQAEALDLLRRNGVRAVLTLYNEPIEPTDLDDAGLAGHHIAVPDNAPPSLDELREGVAFIDDHIGHDEPVYVHCWAGIGRTGTFVAAYLASTGLSADEAVSRIRALRPGSVETAEQLAQVRRFAATLTPPEGDAG